LQDRIKSGYFKREKKRRAEERQKEKIRKDAKRKGYKLSR